MSLTNKEIRAHLRKGELAVELLERLGYEWKPNVNRGPSVWQEPEKNSLLCKLEELIKAEAEKQIPSPKPEPTLKAGDRFVIDMLPPGHKLRHELQGQHTRVFTARAVEQGNGPYKGLVVRFGTSLLNTGYWLPLTHITRIPTHADF